MCVEIEIDGTRYQTVRQLSSVLATVIYKPDTSAEDRVPDNCLCFIDLERTAVANGFIFRSTEDYFHAIFLRK